MENKNKVSSFKPQNNQDKAKPNMTLGQSASQDNVPNSNQQQQQQTSMFQWPYYTPQNGTPTSWHPLPLPHQGQMFWPQLVGPNPPPVYQTFNANGFQANSIVPEVTSSTTQHLVPNMSNQVGYTFPGFLAPWNQSSCLAQMNQLQHFSVPSFAETQSKENAKLWSMVNKLQADVSDYKARLTKLEEEVSSLKKHKVEKPTNEITSTIPVGTGQPRKRGRPSKQALPFASTNALRKFILSEEKKTTLMKSSIFKEVVLKAVENKEISAHSAQNIGNTSNVNRGYWPYGIRTPSQDSARNVLDATPQQRGNITHGCNFANEKDVSKEQKEGTVGSSEDENEEEIGDDDDDDNDDDNDDDDDEDTSFTSY